MQQIYYTESDVMNFILRQKDKKLAYKIFESSYSYLHPYQYVERYFMKHFLRWFTVNRGLTLDIKERPFDQWVMYCYGRTAYGEIILIAPSGPSGCSESLSNFCYTITDQFDTHLTHFRRHIVRPRDRYFTYGDIKPLVHKWNREAFHKPVDAEILY